MPRFDTTLNRCTCREKCTQAFPAACFVAFIACVRACVRACVCVCVCTLYVCVSHTCMTAHIPNARCLHPTQLQDCTVPMKQPRNTALLQLSQKGPSFVIVVA